MFKKPTVASITASFSKQVTQLLDLASAKHDEAFSLRAQAEVTMANADMAADEAAKAAVLATRIAAFTEV